MLLSQKKRLVLLMVIFISLGLFAFWLNYNNESSTAFKKEQLSVSVLDTASIQKIVIIKRGGDTLNIGRVNGKGNWLINEQYKARMQLVNYLKFGLQKIEVKRPVAKSEEKAVTSLLKKEGIWCKVYSENQTREFLIMTNPNDLNSSYFLEGGQRIPYIIYVPGVKGDFSNLLSLSRNDWRAREIFASTPRTLQKLQVSYKERKEEDFEIEYKNRKFIVKDVSNADTVKLIKYISIFSFLNADKFENLSSLPIDLTKAPDVIIKLEDIDSSRNNILKIYFLREINKMVGISYKSHEAMILNPQVFKFVLINKNYFIAKKSNSL